MSDPRRSTIQSVDRAARILKALASGPPRSGVSELAERLGPREDHGPRPAPDPRAAVARRTGPRDREVPARSGDAPARQRVPRPSRAPWPLAAVGRHAGEPGGRGRPGRCPARPARPDRAPRVPAGRLGPDPRGRRVRAVARFGAREGARRRAAERPAPDAARRRPAPADRADDHRIRTCSRSRSRRSREAGFATEEQEAVIGEAEVAAPVFDHRGHPVGAIGVAGPAERVMPSASVRRDRRRRAGHRAPVVQGDGRAPAT